MRRVAGLTLAGLGVVLIAAAVLLPTYASGQIVKFPLDEHTSATLAGTGVSYFSQVKLTEKTGVSVRATYTIKGDAAAGNSSTAVWDETSSVRDVTNGLPVSTVTRRLAFDRRTAELVDCWGRTSTAPPPSARRAWSGTCSRSAPGSRPMRSSTPP